MIKKSIIKIIILTTLLLNLALPLSKPDFQTLRILIDRIDMNNTKLVITGTNISLKYSTDQFPSIYQGGFTLANQITILTLNPILKFYYDYEYEKINNIQEYKDIMILSSSYLEYKGKKYRGKFVILPKDNLVINIVNLDDYLFSVVPSEMPASWNMEALKAQAIIARTYAIKVAIERRKKGELFDLYSTVLDQAYYGVNKENPRTTLAVNQTKDLIIVYQNEPIWALYHSNCAGQTIDGRLVFKNRIDPNHEYLSSVTCYYKGREWENKIDLYTIKKNVERLTKNTVYQINKIYTNNLKTFIVYNNGSIYSLYNWELRKLFGYNVIRSPFYEPFLFEDYVIFKGIGAGHGVGLCQFGANTMAQNGFNYQEIIKYYYKNVEIVDLNKWLEK